jgi:hypothetical protein
MDNTAVQSLLQYFFFSVLHVFSILEVLEGPLRGGNKREMSKCYEWHDETPKGTVQHRYIGCCNSYWAAIFTVAVACKPQCHSFISASINEISNSDSNIKDYFKAARKRLAPSGSHDCMLHHRMASEATIRQHSYLQFSHDCPNIKLIVSFCLRGEKR